MCSSYTHQYAPFLLRQMYKSVEYLVMNGPNPLFLKYKAVDLCVLYVGNRLLVLIRLLVAELYWQVATVVKTSQLPCFDC